MGISPATLSFALDLTIKMSILDLKMHQKMLFPPPSASTWQICFLPIQMHSVEYSAIHRSQKKISFPLGQQSFPISLHLTRDIVEHTCYVFQLQIDYKGISAFSGFAQDERNINSLAHGNIYNPRLLPRETVTEMFSWSNSLLIPVSNAPRSQLWWYSHKSLWFRLWFIFLDHEGTKCSLPDWLWRQRKLRQ